MMDPSANTKIGSRMRSTAEASRSHAEELIIPSYALTSQMPHAQRADHGWTDIFASVIQGHIPTPERLVPPGPPGAAERASQRKYLTPNTFAISLYPTKALEELSPNLNPLDSHHR